MHPFANVIQKPKLKDHLYHGTVSMREYDVVHTIQVKEFWEIIHDTCVTAAARYHNHSIKDA